ncbi:unnamed protein product [Phaeothamnion confervicola]
MAESGVTSQGREDFVQVTFEPLDLRALVAWVSDPRAGAVTTFSGVTRNHHNGKKVMRLEYQGYQPMAEKELRGICVEVREKWDVINVAVVHKLGPTAIEEASVIVAVSSVHRRDGLEATHFAIDALKARVPIWKLEVYEGDSRVWKENVEWKGGTCCRPMVPVARASSGNATETNPGPASEHCEANQHHHKA